MQKSVYDFSALSLDGREIPLVEYRDQVLLLVNTASKCGFTPQYAGLESLYQRFKDRGLVVLGFPCNQFGAQEPGAEDEISHFCSSSYRISFPLFSKIEVNGPHAHPLFRFLRSQRSGLFGALGFDAIKWNFTKFLVDREGQVVARFSPSTTPSAMAPAVERLLSKP